MMFTVKSLSCKIQGRDILTNITFALKEGEILGVIGPNGSGKTTLLNVLSGFYPSTKGAIYLQEEPLQELKPYIRAQKGIGRTFQNSGIFKNLTLLDNILIALEAPRSHTKASIVKGKASKKDLIEQGFRYLDFVNLREYAQSLAGILSGGQLRLLEIARTLAGDPKVILFDEPTAGVSPRMRSILKEKIVNMKKQKYTLIIVEHDMNFLSDICDKVIVLESGHIALEGSLMDLQQNPKLIEMYFGTFNSQNN
jgi:branched-chain amino acid transport system ATP-binding protein